MSQRFESSPEFTQFYRQCIEQKGGWFRLFPPDGEGEFLVGCLKEDALERIHVTGRLARNSPIISFSVKRDGDIDWCERGCSFNDAKAALAALSQWQRTFIPREVQSAIVALASRELLRRFLEVSGTQGLPSPPFSAALHQALLAVARIEFEPEKIKRGILPVLPVESAALTMSFEAEILTITHGDLDIVIDILGQPLHPAFTVLLSAYQGRVGDELGESLSLKEVVASAVPLGERGGTPILGTVSSGALIFWGVPRTGAFRFHFEGLA